MRSHMVSLPYGNETLGVEIPANNLLGVFSPKEVPAVGCLSREIARALENPIGTLPLRELAGGSKSVVLISDDNTRLTPVHLIIPHLLNELNLAGVEDGNIKIVIALGTHRFMTDGEILDKFGREVVDRVEVINHNYKDPEALIYLGTTDNGTEVRVNRTVYEAEFKIGIGSIVPHHIPGFAGGSKIVQPGISGEKTTAQTHLLSVKNNRSYLGLLHNPVREELDLIARKSGVNTIFNTVLNRYGEVVKCFFGDVVEAFQEGARACQDIYRVELPREAEIVLSSSQPCDLEFWQAHKSLYPSDLAVRENGVIIVLTPCTEGVARNHTEIVEYTGYPNEKLWRMIGNGEVRDEVAAALAIAWGNIKERERVFIVSGGIDDAQAEKLKFSRYDTVQEALNAALKDMGEGAKVAVFTHAPDMLPVINKAKR